MGFCVGIVGVAVGHGVGVELGAGVGDGVGAALGAGVGVDVGAALGAGVGTCARFFGGIDPGGWVVSDETSKHFHKTFAKNLSRQM